MKILPKFKDDAEEAQWWYEHRDEIAQDILEASRLGMLGEGTAARRARKLQDFADKQSTNTAA